MALIIHATNIHSGGGAELLLSLLAAIDHQGVAATALVDSRLPWAADRSARLRIVRVKPSAIGRLRAEWLLRKMAAPSDLIFSVGNLPPLLKVRSPVCLFLQNRYLVERVSTGGFSWPVRLRIAVERFWLRHRIGGVERIMVQTASMARLVSAGFGKNSEVLPFIGLRSEEKLKTDPERRSLTPVYDFVYIASGEPHKNHANLIKAWELLADEAIHPSLCITLAPEAYPELVGAMESVREKGGLINNVGKVSHEEVEEIYLKSRALIFPSTLESFGLPLLEAKAAGLAILASELDFVRDVVDPEQTFDPSSCVSIARAVKRFLGISYPPGEICSADHLLRNLVGIEHGKL